MFLSPFWLIFVEFCQLFILFDIQNSEIFWYCLCFHKRYVQNRPSSAEHSAMAEAISKANLDSKRFHSFDTVYTSSQRSIFSLIIIRNFTIFFSFHSLIKIFRLVKQSLRPICAEWSVNLGNLNFNFFSLLLSMSSLSFRFLLFL